MLEKTANTKKLTVNNLSVVAGRTGTLGGARRQFKILSDVSFEVPPCSVFGIIGESGSGKTTLAKSVLGLAPPLDGEIYLGARALEPSVNDRDRHLRRSIQIVFQDPWSSLNPRKTLRSLIIESVDKTLSAARRRTVADDYLQLIGLGPEHHMKLPNQLSGGQRQRVAIARALAAEPDLLILDEPTSSLDLSVQAEILDLILDLKRQRSTTILLITHNIGILHRLADNIAVIYRGEVVECGPADSVLEAPAHPYTKELMSSVPSIGKSLQPIALARDREMPDLNQQELDEFCIYLSRCGSAVAECMFVQKAQRVHQSDEGALDHTAKCWKFAGTGET